MRDTIKKMGKADNEKGEDYEEVEKNFAVLLNWAMVIAMSYDKGICKLSFGSKTIDTASLTVSGLVPGEGNRCKCL